MRSVWLLGSLLWGCGVAAPSPRPEFADPIPLPALGDQALCESSAQCGDGERCVAGICEAVDERADAGADDALGASDVDPGLDGGLADAVASDEGVVDAGNPRDAGATDLAAPPPDAGRPDAATADSGSSPPPFPLGGLSLVNLEQADDQRYAIPPGTSLAPGESLLLVRSADRTELEAVVGPLPSSIHVVSTGASSVGAPIINGGESFQLEDPAGLVLDGPTPVGLAGEGYQRVGPGPGDFQSVPEPVPGHSPPLPSSPTPRIVGWSDRPGTGQFRFEWVELRYDP